MPEYPANRPPAFPPSHPGALLREDVLPALGVSVTAAARARRLPSVAARHPGRARHRHPAKALRLAKLCGDGAEIWLRMQTAHDLWHAERALAEVLPRIPTLIAA